ncbi:MAG: hypothetical protein ACRDTJ_32440 [Pseudonocardiaceae bacterium]
MSTFEVVVRCIVMFYAGCAALLAIDLIGKALERKRERAQVAKVIAELGPEASVEDIVDVVELLRAKTPADIGMGGAS